MISQGGSTEQIYGQVLIGLVFDILLLGIMITQYYIYHTTHTNIRNSLSMKFFVWVLMALDVLKSIINSFFVYDGVITHFGSLLSSTSVLHRPYRRLSCRRLRIHQVHQVVHRRRYGFSNQADQT
ncbi:hypothetical protein Ac2012v2_007237 [Leucoagaricus gongylophorus]